MPDLPTAQAPVQGGLGTLETGARWLTYLAHPLGAMTGPPALEYHRTERMCQRGGRI